MAQQQITIGDKTDNVDLVLASDFNGTKAVVNNNATDAEGRITANESNISTNTGNISTNTSNISANTTAIGTKVDKTTGVRSVTAAGDVNDNDNNNVIEVSGTFSLNFPDGLVAGLTVTIVNVGTGTVTLTAAGTGTIVGKGALTINSEQYSAVTVYARGTDSYVAVGDLV